MPKSNLDSDCEMLELKRKQNHSAVEKKRRKKTQEQLLQLKKLIPSCSVRNDTEKLQILQSTTEYIKKIQELLMEFQSKDPSLTPAISKLLPDHTFSKPSILTLLPSYKPPPQYQNHMNFNMYVQSQRNPTIDRSTCESSAIASTCSTLASPTLTESVIPSESKPKNAMKLSNLLC